MENPFESISKRLANIEVLLLKLEQRQEKPHTQDDHPLLTVTQVSELLKLSIPTIYSKVSRGELPGASKVGRRLLFDRSVLMDYVSERRRKTTKELAIQALNRMAEVNERRVR